MVELSDETYSKLVKNADDNKQLINLIRTIIFGVIAFFAILFIYFGWFKDVLALDVTRRQAELQQQIAIEQAHTNVQIMKIESEGMSKADYFKWLSVREN